MKIGSLNQKASKPLTIFVIGSCIIIVLLLYLVQKADAKALSYYPPENYY